MKRTYQVETPGCHLHLPKAKGRVEVEWSRGDIVDGGELDGIDHGHEGNERGVETNTQCRVRGSGGPEGDQEVMRAVKRD